MAQNPGGGYPPPGFPVGNNGELQIGYPSQSPEHTSPLYPDPKIQQNALQPQSVPPLQYPDSNSQQNPLQAQPAACLLYPNPNSQQNPFPPHNLNQFSQQHPQSMEQLYQQNPQVIEEHFRQNPQFIEEYFLRNPQCMEQVFGQNPQFMEQVFQQHPQFMEHVFQQHPPFMEHVLRQHPHFLEKVFDQHPQFMEQFFQQHPRFMEQVFQQHPHFMEQFSRKHPQFMEQVFGQHPQFMEQIFQQHPQFMEQFSQQHPQFMEHVFRQHPQFMEQIFQQHPQFMEQFSQQHPQFMEQVFRQQTQNPQPIAPQSFPQNSHQAVEQYSQHHSADPQQFQSNSQQYPSPYDDPKLIKPLRLDIQEGQNARDFYIPCHAYEFFQWAFCLSNNNCLESMKNFLYSYGIGIIFFQNKAPVFIFPISCNPDLLVYAFRGASQRHGVVCEFFSCNFTKSEEDLKGFCFNFVKNTRHEGVLLYLDLEQGRFGVHLVGFKMAFDRWRPDLVAEIQKEEQKHILSEPKPFQMGILKTKILHEMKTKLEAEFQVQITFESGYIRLTPTTQEISEKVFGRVHKMVKSCRFLELPFVFWYFLLHQEKAKLHIENEIEKLYNIKVHILVFEEKGTSQLLAFEENGKELGEIEKAVSRLLFLIPSEDTLCQQIFSTKSGKALFLQIVKENEGKLSMILDERQQMCCVGTMDIEGKIKKRLLASLTSQEFVELPSEEVWNFCKKHWQFADIQKNFNCEVNLAKDVKIPWAIEIKGQTENVSCCHQHIAMEVKKIDTQQIACLNFTNGSEAHLVEKLNEGKRCFINLRTRQPIPWKKWIEKRDLGRSLTYSLSFDTISVIGEDDLKITLLPEEQGGATSKEDFQSLHDGWVQVFVPPKGNLKKKDILSRKLTSILKLGKSNLLVDCERLQEYELRYCMKIMCDILNERVGKDLQISECEFHDTRQEMFCWMTEVIDQHLNNKNVHVLQWKGRNINIDVQVGELPHQQDFDVLVNSTSKELELKAGFVSRKLLEMAGPEIQNECKRNYRGGIRVGKIAVTKGYNLKCKFVFHGCMYKYESTASAESFKSVRLFVRNCLETSDKMKMESIAFPALGTGNLGYDRTDIANIIFEEVEKYEKEVEIGFLNRVCCVIHQGDIDAIREFQKRHSLWKNDHNKEMPLELVVTTDRPEIFEEIRQEVLNLKSTNLTEPPESEISESERLGKTTALKDAEKDMSGNLKQESGKRTDSMSKERQCVLLKLKEANKHRSLEIEVRKDFRDLAENIVCPFQSDNQALLQFSSSEGIEKIYQMESLKRKYDLQRFPQQAVVDLRAVVSQKMMKLLKERGITKDLIRQRSGVTIDEKEPDSMVLCGNILEIKAAFDFLSSLLKKPLDNLGQQVSAEDNLHKTDNKTSIDKTNHLKQVPDGGKITEEAKTIPEQLNQFEKASLKLSQVSFTSSMTPSTQNVNKKETQKKESEQVESDIYQPSYAEKNWKGPEMQCTYEDYIKLKHFSKLMLGDVKETWSPNKTTVTMKVANDSQKAELERMLQKIYQMSRKTIALQSKLEILEEILHQKCTNDLFCHLVKGKDKIEITGKNEKIVEKAQKELEELLASNNDVEDDDEEKSIPVFITEGISVYVHHGSLFTAKVDAIVCPISSRFDLYGLPKTIVEKAGPEYEKEVDDILKRYGGKLPEDFICSIPAQKIPSCKFVVNIVTDRSKSKEDKEYKQSLQLKILQICQEAEKMEFQSIALPAICSGKVGYPKEMCANCYASSIVKYSSLADDMKGLKEIHFVDQSEEMIVYIESVFSNPDMIEEFKMEEITGLDSDKSLSSLYPYMDEENTCYLNENLKISVYKKDISKLASDNGTLIYNENLEIASQIKKLLKSPIGNLMGKSRQKSDHGDSGDGELIRDTSGRFEFILKVNMPVWSKSMKSQNEMETFLKSLTLGYAKIFEGAEKLSLFHLILPLYGAVEGNNVITKQSVTCFIQQLTIFADKCKSFQKKQFSIVMANKDQMTCDIILMELKDVVEGEQAGFHPQEAGFQLPRSQRRKTQRRAERWRFGDQPNGNICKKLHENLPGGFNNTKTIELKVVIPNGTQQAFHPNPGKHFLGWKESIFLPDNKLGRKVAGLYIAAFQQRILYTIKTSQTTGVERVMATDIPIDSKRKNPDKQYLLTLLEILKSKIRK